MISDRFEYFAQSLRIFIEQKYRYRELFLIDADEAVGNIELACKSMLDTFASLYDASRAEDQVILISINCLYQYGPNHYWSGKRVHWCPQAAYQCCHNRVRGVCFQF